MAGQRERGRDQQLSEVGRRRGQCTVTPESTVQLEDGVDELGFSKDKQKLEAEESPFSCQLCSSPQKDARQNDAHPLCAICTISS